MHERFSTQAINANGTASWITQGILPKNSMIHGTGLFANRPISTGETVIILGGLLYSIEDAKAGKASQNSTTGFKEGFYLGRPPDQRVTHIDDFLNHSCDPNIWLRGNSMLCARREIMPSEEITIDYGTWEIDEDWELYDSCNCGSHLCRGLVTGRDWRLKELRERYEGHFLPCLVARMLSGKSNSSEGELPASVLGDGSREQRL